MVRTKRRLCLLSTIHLLAFFFTCCSTFLNRSVSFTIFLLTAWTFRLVASCGFRFFVIYSLPSFSRPYITNRPEPAIGRLAPVPAGQSLS